MGKKKDKKRLNAAMPLPDAKRAVQASGNMKHLLTLGGHVPADLRQEAMRESGDRQVPFEQVMTEKYLQDNAQRRRDATFVDTLVMYRSTVKQIFERSVEEVVGGPDHMTSSNVKEVIAHTIASLPNFLRKELDRFGMTVGSDLENILVGLMIDAPDLEDAEFRQYLKQKLQDRRDAFLEEVEESSLVADTLRFMLPKIEEGMEDAQKRADEASDLMRHHGVSEDEIEALKGRAKENVEKRGVGDKLKSVVENYAEILPKPLLKKWERVAAKRGVHRDVILAEALLDYGRVNDLPIEDLEHMLKRKKELDVNLDRLKREKEIIEETIKRLEKALPCFAPEFDAHRAERVVIPFIDSEDGTTRPFAQKSHVDGFTYLVVYGPWTNAEKNGETSLKSFVIKDTEAINPEFKGRIRAVEMKTEVFMKSAFGKGMDWDFLVYHEIGRSPKTSIKLPKSVVEEIGLWDPNYIAESLFYSGDPLSHWVIVANPEGEDSFLTQEIDGRMACLLFSETQLAETFRNNAIKTVPAAKQWRSMQIPSESLRNMEKVALKDSTHQSNFAFVVPVAHKEALFRWAKETDFPMEICKLAIIESDGVYPDVAVALCDLDALRSRKAKEEKLAHVKRMQGVISDAWKQFVKLKPWTRSVFPFWISLKAAGIGLDRCRVEVLSGLMEMPEGEGDDERLVMREGVGLRVTWAKGSSDVMVALVASRDDIERHYFNIQASKMDPDQVMVSLASACLAVTDLLTREIRVVEKKREVKKRLKLPGKLPTIEIDYRPVIYAPRVQTVVASGDGNLSRMLDEQKRQAEEKANTERLEAERMARQRVKHRVPCFRRNTNMSVKQRARLMEMMAEGFVPIDKMGEVIPLPGPNAGYTIVLEHDRGELDPEVVSEKMLRLIEEFRKGK